MEELTATDRSEEIEGLAVSGRNVSKQGKIAEELFVPSKTTRGQKIMKTINTRSAISTKITKQKFILSKNLDTQLKKRRFP